MTGMICRAALIAASLVIAGVALGDSPVPYNPNCTQPPLLVIRLVSQTVDPAGVATYTIRDISNFPIPGCPVTMDFSACGDVRLCTSDVGAGLIIDCNGANRTVQGITDQNGRVQFIIAGAGTGTGPPTFGRCVTVFAGGVPLSNLAATTPDYNGVGGVDSIDLGVFGSDLYGLPANRARSDYNSDLVVNSLDLGRFAMSLVSGSHQSCSALCP